MARLLTLLFEITELFDMETRPELLLLQKTMVVVEGVARSLDPAFNMWKASEPVVSQWIASNLGPRGMITDAKDGLHVLLSLARQLPDLAKRADRLAREIETIAQDGLRLDEETTKAVGKAHRTFSRWGHVALWIIALALLFACWRAF